MAAELLPILDAAGPRPALIVGERRLSTAELAAAAARHRGLLDAHGVGPGDRVGVVAQGALATAIALVGNASYGAVSVPLNPKLGPRELGHILGDAAPKLVFAASPEALGDWPWSTPRVALADVDAEGPTAAAAAPARADAPLLILYTSGTTGAPKGAVLTVGNVASNLDALADAWAWGPDDRVVHALPLFHVHGLILGLFGSLRAGGCLHWLPRFDARALLGALADGGTMLFAVPTMHHRIAELAEADRSLAAALRSARLLISGSAALSAREHRRLAELAGSGVYERYGLTETLINCAVRADGPPQPGRVGPALKGIALRLVADDRQPTIPRDDATIGEVAVRGPNVFAGYLNRADATAAVRDDEGWFYTGDLATWREDGSVRIVGRRATDLIKTGGFKVGAGEVEAVLLEHPSVSEVAVVGIADEDLGERIVAFVVARAGADAAADPEVLIQWVAGQLTPHKRPREVIIVDALPRNPMGKVQKKLLGQRSAASAS